MLRLKGSSRTYFVSVSSSSPSVLLPSPSLHTATVILFRYMLFRIYLRLLWVEGVLVVWQITQCPSFWIQYCCILHQYKDYHSKLICIYLRTPDCLVQSTTSTHKKNVVSTSPETTDGGRGRCRSEIGTRWGDRHFSPFSRDRAERI